MHSNGLFQREEEYDAGVVDVVKRELSRRLDRRLRTNIDRFVDEQLDDMLVAAHRRQLFKLMKRAVIGLSIVVAGIGIDRLFLLFHR